MKHGKYQENSVKERFSEGKEEARDLMLGGLSLQRWNRRPVFSWGREVTRSKGLRISLTLILENLMEKVKRSGRNLQQSQSTGLGFFFSIYLFTYLATLGLSTWDLSLHQHRLSSSVAEVHGFSSSTACFKPESPALQGRFLTTGPPGKSQQGFFSLAKKTMVVSWVWR